MYPSIQISIAIRSFRVVYQCYFQLFSSYSQSVRAKKKEKRKKRVSFDRDPRPAGGSAEARVAQVE